MAREKQTTFSISHAGLLLRILGFTEATRKECAEQQESIDSTASASNLSSLTLKWKDIGNVMLTAKIQ